MRNWITIRGQVNRLLQESNTDRVPVDVEKVARFLKLKVGEGQLGEGVSGLLVRKADDAYVFVKDGEHPNRRRFTIAHEIGHFYLDHDFGPEQIHVDRGYRIHARGPQAKTGDDPKEVEANRFAAALLMPEHHLEAELHERGRAYAVDEDIEALARKFEVSQQAMTIRLSVLGLL